MTISEITLKEVKDYLRLEQDYTDEDVILKMFLDSAIQYVVDYTGLNPEVVNAKEALTPAVFVLCADFYDNRSSTIQSGKLTTKINPVLDCILGMHSVNLL